MTSFSLVYPSLADYKAGKPNYDSSSERHAAKIKQARGLIDKVLPTIKAKEGKRHHITISGDDDAIGVTVQLVDEAQK